MMGAGHFWQAHDLAIDPTNGDVWIGDREEYRIVIYTNSGEYKKTLQLRNLVCNISFDRKNGDPWIGTGLDSQFLPPNLAGRVSAAFALAAQVEPGTPNGRAGPRDGGADLRHGQDHPRRRVATGLPHAFYPEDAWHDDMELGGAELALAARRLGDPRSGHGSPTRRAGPGSTSPTTPAATPSTSTTSARSPTPTSSAPCAATCGARTAR